MQGQGLNSNYLYQLMHMNNGDEVPGVGNSKTGANSSQETAPVRYQYLSTRVPSTEQHREGDRSLWRKEGVSSQLLASTHFQPLQEVGTLATTHTQPAAQLLRKHLPALVPITISLGKKCISWHTLLSTPSIVMEWWWDNEPSTTRMLSQKSF